MIPLTFTLKNVNNICTIVNKLEPFFCYLLSGIKIEFGDYSDIEYMACTSASIKINQNFIEGIQKDKSRLNEFIFIFLHEIYHIYLHHNWRYGFNNDALYSKYIDKPYLPKLINRVLDAIINTNLIEAGYKYGSLEPILLSDVLPSTHPRIQDNSWTEDELLLEVLKSTKAEQKEDGSYDLTFGNGKKINTEDITCDLILSDSEEDLESVESIQEIAKKSAANLRNSGKHAGKLSSKIVPPDIEETKTSNISWEDRLRQIATASFNSAVITNYDNVIADNFYGFNLGLTDFNKCAIEYPYKPLPEPNTIAVYIDLSGSIFSCLDTLSKFVFQISEISKYVGNLLLITFDSGMTGCHLFDMSELEKPLGTLLLEEKSKYLVGGGGTDVIPLFEEFFNSYSNYNVDVNVDNICMLIVLTDLWLEQVNTKLQPVNSKGIIPTLWVVPQSHCSNNISFGELLIIE